MTTQDHDDLIGSGFVSQVGDAGSKPILASLQTASDLLRNLVADALARRGMYLEGKMEPAEAQQEDVAACLDLAELLMGRGPRSVAFFVQPWNSPEQLGQFLIDSYDLECKDDEAVFSLLVSMLSAVYQEVDSMALNKQDAEEEGWRLDGIIEAHAHALTGIPYPTEDE
jgi:hypothetical protein